MDECPVCLEELSNTTTRVTTECCNNVLHLQCFKDCKYKCPLCRHEIDINQTTPLISQHQDIEVYCTNDRMFITVCSSIMIMLVYYIFTLIDSDQHKK